MFIGCNFVNRRSAANNVRSSSPSDIPASVLRSIEQHMQRYRQLTAQGQLEAAGRELQAIDDELQKALPKGKH